MRSRNGASGTTIHAVPGVQPEDLFLQRQVLAALQAETASLRNQIAANEGHLAPLRSQIDSSTSEVEALLEETAQLERQIRENEAKKLALQTANKRAAGRRREATREIVGLGDDRCQCGARNRPPS